MHTLLGFFPPPFISFDLPEESQLYEIRYRDADRDCLFFPVKK